MPILKVNDKVTFSLSLNMKIVRSFAIEDSVFYIASLKEETKVKSVDGSPLFVVLKYDGTCDSIPAEAMQQANYLIEKEKLL